MAARQGQRAEAGGDDALSIGLVTRFAQSGGRTRLLVVPAGSLRYRIKRWQQLFEVSEPTHCRARPPDNRRRMRKK